MMISSLEVAATTSIFAAARAGALGANEAPGADELGAIHEFFDTWVISGCLAGHLWIAC